MTELTNADRADYALTAIDAFNEACPGEADLQTQIKDLMTNIAHLARFNDLDIQMIFDLAMDMAGEEELEDEDGDIDAVVRACE